MRKIILNILATSALLSPMHASAQGADTRGPLPPSVLVGGVEAQGDGVVPFRCPIDRIRTAYQNLVDPDDSLMALAIEKQTLAICRQSQEALIRIAENEIRLRELFEPIMVPVIPVVEPEPPIAQIWAPDPARNVTETLPVDPSIGVEEADAPDETIPDVDPDGVDEAEPEPRTDFTLGVLMRDPEGRKAILLRGEEIFTVREGEMLDEGTRVLLIEEASVTIVDADDNEFVLE